MASKTIEQFHSHGLDMPIRIKPGIRAYLFLFLAMPSMIAGSILAIAKGGPIDALAGLIVLPMFGLGLVVYSIVIWRSHRRGMLEFSNRGIHHGLYQLDLDWRDIGPAWTFSLHAGGRPHEDVLFILRNVSRYRPMLGPLGRLLFAIMERQGRSASGGALDTSTRSLMTMLGQGQAGDDAVNALEKMRQVLRGEPDAIVLGLPRIIRFGLSNEDTVEIINTVVLKLADKRLAL
jgi:hypothetical protein